MMKTAVKVVGSMAFRLIGSSTPCDSDLDNWKAREQLVPLVKEFGVSAVRVGINNEARRQGKEGEGDENAKRYKDLLQLLPVRKLARNKTRKSGTKTKSAKAGKPEAKKEKPAAGQTPFFETQAVKSGRERRIRIADMFTPKEMEGLSTQLNLGSAAVSRHISELKLSRGRGLGHSDPRALDWAMQDQKHFQFLASQVRQARRQNNGGGEELDLSSLEDEDLFDLWEFSKFEADRAHRNIDHLTSGLSHLKGPTAEYLSGRHKLDARFYTILANKIEPMITPDMYERHYVGL